MTPEASRVSESGPAGMSTLARITGVFFEPGKTFEDIGRRPTWFLPLLLVMLAGIVFTFMLGQQVGWEQVMTQERNITPKVAERVEQQMANVPADQRQRAMDLQVKIITPARYYGQAILGPPIAALVRSGILMLIVGVMMSAGLRFKQVFAIVCFASLPRVLEALLKAVVVVLKKQEINIFNPLAFNPGAFMDMATSNKFIYALAVSFDLFTIWIMVLMAVGLSAAAGRKRLSFGGALFAVAMPWLLMVLFGGTMASIFS
jgi:Yip1 domain